LLAQPYQISGKLHQKQSGFYAVLLTTKQFYFQFFRKKLILWSFVFSIVVLTIELTGLPELAGILRIAKCATILASPVE